MTSSLRIQSLLFAMVAAGLFLIHGNKVVFTLDEGIILDTAQRVMAGQRPYVDFFGYMSPGSYWLQVLVFKLFGISLLAGRILPILDWGIQSALVFRLVDQFGTRKSAFVTTGLFFASQLCNAGTLTAHHRWDSGTLALGAICLALDARRLQSTWRVILSGVLAGAAALCTPSMALVPIATFLWLVVDRRGFKQWLPYACGVLGIGAAAAAWLLAEGTLMAFVQQLLWLQKNYTAVNLMPYGSVIGGYDALIRQGLVPTAFAGFLAVPAILPFLVWLGLGVSVWRSSEENRSPLFFLLAAMTAMVITAFPRPDVGHISFVTALPYALMGIWVARSWSNRQAAYFVAAFAVVPAAFLMHFGLDSMGTSKIGTPVGELRVAPEDSEGMAGLMRQVKPGQSLYVHPYMPVLYFLTQAANPTRFSYLAPGMMTPNEEEIALQELEKHPPQQLMHLKWTREEFLRVFPGGRNLSEKFPRIETWIEQNYTPVEPQVFVSGYKLLHRKEAPAGM